MKSGVILPNSKTTLLPLPLQSISMQAQVKNSELRLTPEQKAIIASTGNIRINAVAGSGKTTTIIQYAASRPPSSRILYLAFNKSVRLEAKKRFTDLGLHNVQVETAHSLAFKHIVAGSQLKVSQSGYKTYDIAEQLGLQDTGEKHGAYILANHINKFISYFCNSHTEKVQDLNYLDIIVDDKAKVFVQNYYSQLEYGTRLLLSKMHKGEIEITHDFYLKLFQLTKPQLRYDYILFDEGQDASPAMLDIFLKQSAIKVIVGDTHQQIYGWRHAVNSLGKVDFASYDLSTSFRFGQNIADLAMEVLYWKEHLGTYQPMQINGKEASIPSRKINNQEGSSLSMSVDRDMPLQSNQKIEKQASVKLKTRATIARTNLGLLLKAITYINENKKVKAIYFEGNIQSYTYADDGASLYDVLDLYNGNKGRIRDKMINSMKDIKELEDYIEKTEDVQLSIMVDIVKEYGNDIPSLLKTLKSKHVGDEYKSKAEMIFSTVHRAKGMEYDQVELVDDFITEPRLIRQKKEEEKIDIAKMNEEINLLYVAITRTKGLLMIHENLLPLNFPITAGIQVIQTELKTDTAKSVKSFSFTEKRLEHKNAYERWSEEMDAELRTMYHKGVKMKSLADHFGRKQGAILSRLKKIGCVEMQ